MTNVALRAVVRSDLPVLVETMARQGEQFEFFGFPSANALERWFNESGCLNPDRGLLVVVADDVVVGQVTWHATEYGPGGNSRAWRMGVALIPGARGRGYGTTAQRLLADYLFSTSLVQRVEAGTDIENIAEQRALEKAGFTRDGVMRQAQYRDGSWHDMVIYSRLRHDPA
jgi:RimJ/RimL family protein N-acetyltransferase